MVFFLFSSKGIVKRRKRKGRKKIKGEKREKRDKKKRDKKKDLRSGEKKKKSFYKGFLSGFFVQCGRPTRSKITLFFL